MFSLIYWILLLVLPTLALLICGAWLVRRATRKPQDDSVLLLGGIVFLFLGTGMLCMLVVVGLSLTGTTETVTVVEQVVIQSPPPTLASGE